MNKKYQIIYADPPWDYKGQTQHTGKDGISSGGSKNHYGTLKLPQLKTLDIDSIADRNCLLFMWSTNPHLDQAIDLMKAWGFKWATVGFVWNKERVNPGFYTMSQMELCLIGKRGKIPLPRGSRNVRQLVTSLRGRHSEKPDEVRKRIEEMFPYQNKIELFARHAPHGWDVWGDEVAPTLVVDWK
jgi:N6-adenosine-specific RNA methylase IME4